MDKLDKRLEGKFEMVKLVPGEVVFKGRKYDTRKMTTTEANELIKNGASFIQKVIKVKKE